MLAKQEGYMSNLRPRNLMAENSAAKNKVRSPDLGSKIILDVMGLLKC